MKFEQQACYQVSAQDNVATALGDIPAGSTNDVASSLVLPKNMRKAAQTAALGKPFLVDVGVFGKNRYFVYVAAFGAFTEVSYSTPQETKNILGHQAYMLEAIKPYGRTDEQRKARRHSGDHRDLIAPQPFLPFHFGDAPLRLSDPFLKTAHL